MTGRSRYRVRWKAARLWPCPSRGTPVTRGALWPRKERRVTAGLLLAKTSGFDRRSGVLALVLEVQKAETARQKLKAELLRSSNSWRAACSVDWLPRKIKSVAKRG